MARSPAASDEDEVSRAVIALSMAEAFFAHVVQGLPRRIDNATATVAIAVTGNVVELRVNPAYFLSLSKGQRVAVLKHEILHLVLKHPLRTQGRDPQLWSLACDVVVNDLVDPWPLPAGAVTRATFPDLGLPDDVTADVVYAKLKAMAGARKPPSRDLCPERARALGEQLSGPRITEVGGHGDHSAWAERDEMGTATEAFVDGVLVRAADRTGAASFGLLPGTVRDAIVQARERGRPQVDWRRAVRFFAASAGRTRLVTTTRRESARYGRTALPGRAGDPRAPTTARLAAGTKIRRQHELLVAVDTSGSISNGQLDAFFTEIHGIWRAGAHVLVAACDAEVHGVFEYRGTVPLEIGGGGGTAFDPVFAWMRDQREHRFDGVIYLTDGYGPAPETRPPCKVLWVVTSDDGMGEHLPWGRQIRLG